MSRAGARTWLQPTGHGDMQGFDSSFAALVFFVVAFVFVVLFTAKFESQTTQWVNLEKSK